MTDSGLELLNGTENATGVFQILLVFGTIYLVLTLKPNKKLIWNNINY